MYTIFRYTTLRSNDKTFQICIFVLQSNKLIHVLTENMMIFFIFLPSPKKKETVNCFKIMRFEHTSKRDIYGLVHIRNSCKDMRLRFMYIFFLLLLSYDCSRLVEKSPYQRKDCSILLKSVYCA